MSLLVLGIAGMVLILAAFVFEEFAEHTRSESILYNVLNLVGSSLLVGYAWDPFSPPFFFLNLVWAAVASVKLASLLVAGRAAA